MGKRIIQQARGKGSLTYRVKRKAYSIRLQYPGIREGKGKIISIINSPAHSCPIAIVKTENKKFYVVAPSGIIEGQEIDIGKSENPRTGDILPLKSIPLGTAICNLEVLPGDGGKLVRTAGTCAKIVKIIPGGISVLMPSKQEKIFNPEVRATIGETAAAGRKEKSIVKAGKKWHMMKARNKLWPRTSPIKMNVVDHPFGSGRGKNMGKSGIAPVGAPPGRKVGLLRPRKTGRGKGSVERR
ncbi:50S ribosomal protein L2 [Candidatus Pacearchaeota archaeon CG06_land_8_20_14_3_00_35_12]|nr:MAG: 50S ribosomal protein L2 [Candidatus Pacearchaeota archaeon CG06_land_8_20_14_3_00_35_12]